MSNYIPILDVNVLALWICGFSMAQYMVWFCKILFNDDDHQRLVDSMTFTLSFDDNRLLAISLWNYKSVDVSWETHYDNTLFVQK